MLRKLILLSAIGLLGAGCNVRRFNAIDRIHARGDDRIAICMHSSVFSDVVSFKTGNTVTMKGEDGARTVELNLVTGASQLSPHEAECAWKDFVEETYRTAILKVATADERTGRAALSDDGQLVAVYLALPDAPAGRVVALDSHTGQKVAEWKVQRVRGVFFAGRRTLFWVSPEGATLANIESSATEPVLPGEPVESITWVNRVEGTNWFYLRRSEPKRSALMDSESKRVIPCADLSMPLLRAGDAVFAVGVDAEKTLHRVDLNAGTDEAMPVPRPLGTLLGTDGKHRWLVFFEAHGTDDERRVLANVFDPATGALRIFPVAGAQSN